MVKISPFLKGRTGLGLSIVISWLAVGLLAPLLTPYNPNAINLQSNFCLSSFIHPLGCDELGRDILARLLYGARVTFEIVGVVALVTVPAGLSLGLITFFSQAIDSAVSVINDVLFAFPNILLALVLVAALGPGTINVAIAVGLSNIPYVARITRSTIADLRHVEFVEAALTTGESNLSILFRYIFANSYQPIIVQSIVRLSYSVITVAFLSFIGLGVQVPQAEWGAMMVGAAPYLASHPELILYPGIALLTLVMGFNILGDGLQSTLHEIMR